MLVSTYAELELNNRIGKHVPCSSASLVLLVLLAVLEGEATAALPLFNGVDLTGWTKLGGDGTYHVENGEIVGTSAAPSSPNTFLVTDSDYSNFVLDIDFLISNTNFNSGVQLRSQSDPMHNGGRVYGYQVDIDPTSRAWSGGIYFEGGSPDRPAGWLDDLDDTPAAQAAFVLGAWNNFRIIADGTHITTWINGVPAANYTDEDPNAFLPSGFFGLQVHQVSTSTPREVRWRNILLHARPTLRVNRETGEISLHNEMDVAIDLQQYSVASVSNSFDAGPFGWNSLSDQGVTGWGEIAATTTLLQEESSSNPFVVGAGSSRSLGRAYVPSATAFGVDAEDLSLSFTEQGLASFTGKVEYFGQNIANNLVLFVDPDTGQGVLKNTSPFPVSIAGYSILSPSESIEENNWQSLSTAYAINGWDETPRGPGALSELGPLEDLLLSPGDRYNLGYIYDTVSGVEDFQLEFLVAGDASFSQGATLFRKAADFNLDGMVDNRDLQNWETSYGSNGEADADGNGVSNGQDFLIWQQQTGLSHLQTGGVVAVPEPSVTLLLGIECIVLALSGRC